MRTTNKAYRALYKAILNHYSRLAIVIGYVRSVVLSNLTRTEQLYLGTIKREIGVLTRINFTSLITYMVSFACA